MWTFPRLITSIKIKRSYFNCTKIFKTKIFILGQVSRMADRKIAYASKIQMLGNKPNNDSFLCTIYNGIQSFHLKAD